MLYNDFRESVVLLHNSINTVLEYSAPNYGTVPPDNVLKTISKIKNLGFRLEKIIQNLPDEIEGFRTLGPILHPDDLKVVLSLMMDLVLSFDSDCPLRSIYPVVLYKTKKAILMEYIYLFSSWKYYFKAPREINRDYYSPFLGEHIKELDVVIGIDDNILDKLFENLKDCISLAKEGIENDFQLRYTEI
ncbi:hypothetical protein ACFOEK_00540 [Litoribrevibacter euphylliae]|uniref:Uncharacterized protein n=1 Tax=Litoribrevibacter euphylliae TaxID=1834034 RepID=A0ABV7HA12_9GAMM